VGSKHILKKVQFKNVGGIIDLYEEGVDKVRITDFKTGVIYNIDDGKNSGIKEAYIKQLKAYGYIVYKTEQVKAENIELVIKGLGDNEFYTFVCNQKEYDSQGLKIHHLLNKINKIIDTGNLNNLASPEPGICNFCNHQFRCAPLHNSVRSAPEKWDNIILLKTINVTFDSSKLSINVLVNDRTKAIHNIPEIDFNAIKNMNENNEEVLITQLFQLHDSNVKKWSTLSSYNGI
jgi:hypothetical protein